jgi:hypothetical protein
MGLPNVRNTILDGATVADKRIRAGCPACTAERRRVTGKACRQIRAAQLFYLNDTVGVGADGSPEGLDMFIAQSESPLRIMKTNREISDGCVVIPPGQNILSASVPRTKIRVVPLGRMSYTAWRA